MIEYTMIYEKNGNVEHLTVMFETEPSLEQTIAAMAALDPDAIVDYRREPQE